MTKIESPPSATDGKHSGIGAPVRRREDLRLVRGAGRYTDDGTCPARFMPSWCARRTRMR